MLFEYGFRKQALEELRASTRKRRFPCSFIRRSQEAALCRPFRWAAETAALLNFDAPGAYLEKPAQDEVQTARGIRPVDERWWIEWRVLMPLYSPMPNSLLCCLTMNADD